MITDNKMKQRVTDVEVWKITEYSFSIVRGRNFRQTGIVTGIMAKGGHGTRVFHIVDWGRWKERRLAHYSYSADILAYWHADDRGYRLKEAHKSISPTEEKKHIPHVDSSKLFDTITTLHDGKEYRLRKTVQRIRDSFEGGDIDMPRLFPSGKTFPTP